MLLYVHPLKVNNYIETGWAVWIRIRAHLGPLQAAQDGKTPYCWLEAVSRTQGGVQIPIHASRLNVGNQHKAAVRKESKSPLLDYEKPTQSPRHGVPFLPYMR